jgi:glycosyltransferase involved in cell wall biosynthesis
MGRRGGSRLVATLAELIGLWRTRGLARRLVDRIDPAVLVVIQDTLLLERFLVREANRRGRGTLVVQWAFMFPQSTYDHLNEIQRGRVPATADAAASDSRRRTGPGGRLYALAQALLGVRFDLVHSHGGGEARVFAVMGEVFREQFLSQGVRKERIEVTGHPLHDAAFAQRAALSAERAGELKARYGLPNSARVILYATQPVLWRAVVTREELSENVRALGQAVADLGPEYLLVLKLHPREELDDYGSVVEGDLPIRLVKDAEIAELIAPAEVFISSSSSTVLLAMMLDKPIVTVNFNRVPHFDYYEGVGGTLHARTPAAAAEALRLALRDEPTRARLAAERERVLGRYSRFDGRATERIANLVDEVSAKSVSGCQG